MRYREHIALSLPIDLPTATVAQVLVQVRTKIAESKLEIGQRVAASFHVHAATNWSGDVTTQSLAFKFEVLVKNDDWLVSGLKKGSFSLQANVSGDRVLHFNKVLTTVPPLPQTDDEHPINLTLVPLRAGTLFLPTIQVSPVEHNLSSETQNVDAASVSDNKESPTRSGFDHVPRACQSIEVLPTSAQGVFMLEPDPRV